MALATELVGLDAILAARELLDGIIHRTPLEGSRPLSELVGGPAYLKCENLQRAGSFKIRGAYVRIAGLSDAERARGVVAASAGNHAQGVALAASLLGTTSTVFMPVTAPLPKIAATKSYGAEVFLRGATVDEALLEARDFGERTGAVLIHPFDHADIVAGQATLGLEIVEQCPDVATVVVSCGGGGVLSGIAAAVRATKPGVRVFGVQADGAAAFPASLAAGEPIALEQMSTIADGIAVGRPGEVTFAHVRDLVDGIRTVPEEALSRALLLLLERSKMVVEPAGAASVAAAMEDATGLEPPVVFVLSGGNIDPVLLMRVIQHGMAAAGRYLSLRVEISDSPGSLARLLQMLAEQQASVLSVEHERTAPQLHLGDVEVALSLETKGQDHCAALLRALTDAGYRIVPSTDRPPGWPT